MEELKQHMEEAFRILNGWSVSGEMVEQMAMVRIHLRQALMLAQEEQKEKECDNGD